MNTDKKIRVNPCKSVAKIILDDCPKKGAILGEKAGIGIAPCYRCEKYK